MTPHDAIQLIMYGAFALGGLVLVTNLIVRL